MTTQIEQQLENNLITQLEGLGFVSVKISTFLRLVNARIEC